MAGMDDHSRINNDGRLFPEWVFPLLLSVLRYSIGPESVFTFFFAIAIAIVLVIVVRHRHQGGC
jgi:hypothetical protein